MKNNKGKELINKTTSYLKYSKRLKNCSDNEKKFFICQAKNPELIDLFLTNCSDKIECYFSIFQNDDDKLSEGIYNVLINDANDYEKYQYIGCLKDEEQKMQVILSINDLFIRGLSLYCLDISDQEKVVKTIADDEILKQICIKTSNIFVLCAINDDYFKQDNLKYWDIENQVKIICSLQSDEVKYYYTKNPIYKEYLAQIVLSFKDWQYKPLVFKEHPEIDFKLIVISQTQNIEEYNYLLGLLPQSFYKSALGLDRHTNKEQIIKYMKLPKESYDINSELTFQVEFDIDVSFLPEIHQFISLLCNWKVIENPYYNNMVKIISPKLKYNQDGFKELKLLCDLLKDNRAYPINNSLMNIKFNFDYLSNFEEFVSLIKLYIYLEPLLNDLCNRLGCGFVETKTLPFYYLLQYLNKCDHDFYLNGNLADVINKMNMYTDSDAYSLSFRTCSSDDKMIEFKMANSELEFNELSKTIILFAKLLEKAKLIANITKKSFARESNLTLETIKTNYKLLTDGLNERKSLLKILSVLDNLSIDRIFEEYSLLYEDKYDEQKVEGLLNIFFDTEEERQKYRERYLINKNLRIKRR